MVTVRFNVPLHIIADFGDKRYVLLRSYFVVMYYYMHNYCFILSISRRVGVQQIASVSAAQKICQLGKNQVTAITVQFRFTNYA